MIKMLQSHHESTEAKNKSKDQAVNSKTRFERARVQAYSRQEVHSPHLRYGGSCTIPDIHWYLLDGREELTIVDSCNYLYVQACIKQIGCRQY